MLRCVWVYFSSLAVRSAQTPNMPPTPPWCWGFGESGQLGAGNTSNEVTPELVGESTALEVGWTQLSAENHTCALREDQTLWCWGGRIGLSNTQNYSTPQQVLNE